MLWTEERTEKQMAFFSLKSDHCYNVARSEPSYLKINISSIEIYEILEIKEIMISAFFGWCY